MGISRVGAKLGTARDARTAHAVVAMAKPHIEATQDIVNRAWNVWFDNGQQGTEPPMGLDYPAMYAPYLPHGWQYLGQGCYRTVLLHDGVVYKVNSDLEDNANGNGDELRSIKAIRHRGVPMGWAVPDATLYQIAGEHDDYVIAMPLIDTSAPLAECYYDECTCNNSKGNKRLSKMHKNICSNDVFSGRNVPFWDLHNGNVFPDSTGLLWVIDVSLPT